MTAPDQGRQQGDGYGFRPGWTERKLRIAADVFGVIKWDHSCCLVQISCSSHFWLLHWEKLKIWQSSAETANETDTETIWNLFAFHAPQLKNLGNLVSQDELGEPRPSLWFNLSFYQFVRFLALTLALSLSAIQFPFNEYLIWASVCLAVNIYGHCPSVSVSVPVSVPVSVSVSVSFLFFFLSPVCFVR